MNDVATLSRITAPQRAVAEAGALDYRDYVAGVPANGSAFREAYDAVVFTPEEKAAITAIAKPLRVLAIVEEWCPDVVANLPIFARIAELNSRVALRILYRPDHRAIADAYPGSENRSHIPTYILFDEAGRERGVLIERPAAITERIAGQAAAAKERMSAQYPGKSREELPADFIAELTAQSLASRAGLRDIERAGIVDWLVQTAA